MTKPAAGNHHPHAVKMGGNGKRTRTHLIHPVVIYPFTQPGHYTDLEGLYELVGRLDTQRATYARPLTVIDAKTQSTNMRNEDFLGFVRSRVERHSEVLPAWCVDTCQMWYTGLGAAFQRGKPEDVYWLIPGDFNYGSSTGREVLSRLHDLPEIIQELNQDICVGEITTDHNNSKQLLDTYGTFALLYNWFPAEAQQIREMTERPRSEFFAIRHEFLAEMLSHRWYAYEQTVVILLYAVFGQKRISRFCVGSISDIPEGKESLSSAIQQVERTERVLKSVWRQRHAGDTAWADRYVVLEAQSEQIRRTAMTILRNLLA